MIVTCPSCSVRYLVDPRALGQKGRTVRCARCGHTWHQDPAEETPSAAPPPPPAGEGAPAAAEDAAPRRPASPSLAAERRIQLPAVRRPRRRWGPALASVLTLIVMVAGLAYAAVLERDRVIAILPAAAGVFARLGFPSSANGVGLEFRNVTTSREMSNGLPALVVSGEVTNVSSIPRDVPTLVVILRDKTDHDLQNATISMNQQQLAPGETVPFHASITQPPEAASDVVVTFAGADHG
jgi:predicted Zn finger-like uncharacterized protein